MRGRSKKKRGITQQTRRSTKRTTDIPTSYDNPSGAGTRPFSSQMEEQQYNTKLNTYTSQTNNQRGKEHGTCGGGVRYCRCRWREGCVRRPLRIRPHGRTNKQTVSSRACPSGYLCKCDSLSAVGVALPASTGRRIVVVVRVR
jgi:hypothetical protein